MKYHELPPNAGRVINSLRDSGYDFNTAVADIVDNSIAAGATIVKIFATCDSKNGEIRVAIADNGCGMDLDELCNAMTYGSSEREDTHSLGKFGLGLKTASTSQCRRVTVLSRKHHGEKPNKLVLDIDHAEATQRWEYIEDEPTSKELQYLSDAAKSAPGTVVVWDNCDRIMGREYKNPGGRVQQKAFDGKVDALKFHLSLVFERFLNLKDPRARTINLYVRGDLIKPFDPFALRLKTMTPFDNSFMPSTKTDGGKLHVATHVVPARDELKLQSDMDAVFPSGLNPDRLQGLYVYRENRLIHWGDWCGLYKTEFHQRLCRVEVSFDASFDDYFSIDFQKSKVTISPEIAEWLTTKVLPKTRTIANDRYRKGVVETETKKASPVHTRANKTIASFESSGKAKKLAVTNLGNNKRRVSSDKGRSFVEPIPEESKKPNGVNIRLVESLPDDALWKAGLFDGEGAPRVYVEINVSHPFYQRVNYACGENTNAARCIDYLLWSLASAEYGSKDQGSYDNYDDMIHDVSRILRMLSKDLPVDESQ